MTKSFKNLIVIGLSCGVISTASADVKFEPMSVHDYSAFVKAKEGVDKSAHLIKDKHTWSKVFGAVMGCFGHEKPKPTGPTEEDFNKSSVLVVTHVAKAGSKISIEKVEIFGDKAIVHYTLNEPKGDASFVMHIYAGAWINRKVADKLKSVEGVKFVEKAK